MVVDPESKEECKMGRYTGPKVKLSRREGQDLGLKGAKTFSDKNPFKRKPQAPGQHGLSRRRLSDYGLQLREKQKLKRIYGLFEKQFRNYYKKATRMQGITGDNLIILLESRLDNALYRSGLASTRSQARKWTRQGKFLVNGVKTDIPSYLLSKGDVIGLSENKMDFLIPEDYEAPVWLNFIKTKNEIKIKSLPKRNDINEVVNEQLIIDYYSR